MKIGIIHSYYSNLGKSGENNVVDAQIEVLLNMGHQLQIFSSSSLEKSSNSLYKFRSGVNVLAGIGDDPQEALETFKPDVILSHNLFPNISTGWLRKFGHKTFSFKHNYRDICASGNLYRNANVCVLCVNGTSLNGFLNKCYKNSALMSLPISLRNSFKIRLRPELNEPRKFLVLSNKMKEILLSTQVPIDKFEVIPNFISDPYYGKLNSETRNNGWVTSGRLTKEKGFSELIDFWPNSYKLDIYGEGPLLEELKIKTKNKENISIKGGVSRTHLSKLLPSYIGAILPSRWFEPGPLTVLEYLAAGLPIISTGVWSDAAGLDISNHVDAHGVGNEEITQQLVNLIRQLEIKSKETSNSQREKYLREFTPEIWYGRLIEIIEG